jgi:hypothetical protein
VRWGNRSQVAVSVALPVVVGVCALAATAYVAFA